MRPIILLLCVLLVILCVGIATGARFSRRLMSRTKRQASGQYVRITERLIVKREDGAPIEEDEVERRLPDNRKRFLHTRYVPNNVVCRSVVPPGNGYISCTSGPDIAAGMRICTAGCTANYTFPDGSRQKYYNCTARGFVSNRIRVPHCQPAKDKVERRLSDNSKHFLHIRYVPNNVVCRSVVPPGNGYLLCYTRPDIPAGMWMCRAGCIANYKFPDGSPQKHYNCTNLGLASNRIRVPHCQPARTGCGEIAKGAHQTKFCVVDEEKKICKSQCHPRYRFSNGQREMTAVCMKNIGVYRPIDRFTDCLLTNITGDKEVYFHIDM